jgi:hypothetical protein
MADSSGHLSTPAIPTATFFAFGADNPALIRSIYPSKIDIFRLKPQVYAFIHVISRWRFTLPASSDKIGNPRI